MRKGRLVGGIGILILVVLLVLFFFFQSNHHSRSQRTSFAFPAEKDAGTAASESKSLGKDDSLTTDSSSQASSPDTSSDAVSFPSDNPSFSATAFSDTLKGGSFGISVNGEVIQEEKITTAYNSLPPQVRQTVSKNDVAEHFIEQALLLQEAKRKGILATDAEVMSFIDHVKNKAGYDDSQFLRTLQSSGKTPETYALEVRDALTIAKLLNEELDVQNVKASSQDIANFLDMHRAEFKEFFDENDPALIADLQDKIGMKLTKEKQDALVANYIAQLAKDAKMSQVSS